MSIDRYREAKKVLAEFDAWCDRSRGNERRPLTVAVTITGTSKDGYNESRADLNVFAQARLVPDVASMIEAFRASLVARIAKLHTAAVKDAAALIVEEPPQ